MKADKRCRRESAPGLRVVLFKAQEKVATFLLDLVVYGHCFSGAVNVLRARSGTLREVPQVNQRVPFAKHLVS